MDTAALPLAGVKVVELSTFITGPYAGMLLADMGADVIKVERPDGGDPFRGYDSGNYSPQYCAFNRNKQSLTLDLGNAAARAILLQLAAGADVVIENFRPGVTDALGVGESAMRAGNPAVIYCSITGFGHDGPYRDRPAYDTVAQGYGGLLGQFIDGDAPLIRGPALADSITGLYAALCVAGALAGRGRTRQGTRIDVTMLEAITAFSAEPFSQFLATGAVPTPYTRATISQSSAFRCADAKMIAIHLSSPEKFWRGLVAAIDRAELATDARFATRAARVTHFFELREELAAVFATRPRAAWMASLDAADVPVAPVYGLDEVIADPQTRHMNLFAEIAHPVMGRRPAQRPPFRWNGAAGETMAPPPTLGEHTAAILASLGYDEQAIARLRDAGAV